MIFQPYPNEQRDLRWVTVTLTSIATSLLIVRLATTWKQRGWFGLEDVCVIISAISLICLATVIYMSTLYGFGTHVVDIKKSGGNLVMAMKYFWYSLIFYTICNGFTKLAFLALYYRVFATKGFRKMCLVMAGLSVAWTVSYLAVSIFNCSPIPRVYDRTIPGTCVNFHIHRWSNAGTNLLLDLIIFIMPMPLIMKLNMSLGNRLGLILLFSIGFFICLITLLRMATLPSTLRAKEPTWESAPTNLWSYIESAVGVICACLISIRRTISQFWPKMRRSNKGSSGASGAVYDAYGNSRRGSQPLSSGHHKLVPAGSYPLSPTSQTKPAASVTIVSRGSSQERMIDGINVTKDVDVVRS
ncbi:hypothetical protein P280DRAFT_432362 [Massarina eburnea CBS 473.64]|uniref:Rhodopsin domain-containing protein n=1 Tax=Massarina eburnea CBS 473.64 TaxID=1395130 RepID=A0A6A6RS08_9PLEO|nr:hypothetical protein P280DRAFT_432362 [Massarina eburnea CBS 473.64]